MRNLCACGHRLAIYSLGNKKVRDVLCRSCRREVNKQLESCLRENGWKLVKGEWKHI